MDSSYRFSLLLKLLAKQACKINTLIISQARGSLLSNIWSYSMCNTASILTRLYFFLLILLPLFTIPLENQSPLFLKRHKFGASCGGQMKWVKWSSDTTILFAFLKVLTVPRGRSNLTRLLGPPGDTGSLLLPPEKPCSRKNGLTGRWWTP